MQTSFKNNKKEKSETMGYLAQRKKHLRTDFILKSLLVLLAFFSVAAFAGNAFGQFLNQWRFQFYLLSLLVMFYALFNRFFLYSFLALLLLLLNFFVVSSSVPVLFSGGEGKGKTAFGMIYQPRPSSLLDIFETADRRRADLLAVIDPVLNGVSLSGLVPAGYHLADNDEGKSFMVSSRPPRSAGRIGLGGGRSAAFVSLEIGGRGYVFLSFDLSGMSRRNKEKALGYVNAFVAAEDDPVIIFGDFGMTAWSPAFGRFLASNRLEVKNDLFSRFAHLLMPPTQYVVGYRNLEFAGSRRLPRLGNRSAPSLIRLKI